MYVQLDARLIEEGCGKVVCSWKSSELETAEPCEEKHQKPRPQPNSVFAQFSVVCMFNWMFGQLRKAIGRSYVRGRAPNLNRLSSVRENAINPHPQPNSVFAQFPVVCMFSWMLGQLRKTIRRSYLKGGSYVRGKTLNLSRLSSAKERK